MTENDAYLTSLAGLRARGCRCPLWWDATTQQAVPATGCNVTGGRTRCSLMAPPPCSDVSDPPAPTG